MVDAQLIVDQARSWLGTPFHHQAATKGVGCDCIGLIAGVAKELGLPEANEFFSTPELRSYGRQPDPTLLLTHCERLLTRIDFSEARPGDVLLMRFKVEPQHFALLTRDNPKLILHAYQWAERVVETHLGMNWRSRIFRTYRFKGIA